MTATQPYSGATAVVIGGSIGGLTAALLLRDLGFDVHVYERTPSALDGRGSGIVLRHYGVPGRAPHARRIAATARR